MELRVHLKICEGCGCLWYRSQSETRVYCTACNQRLKEFPTQQDRKRRGRPRKTTLPTVYAVQASTAEMELAAFESGLQASWRQPSTRASVCGGGVQ